MSIRLLASPPVLVGAVYTAKAAQYCTGGYSSVFPSNADGTPASSLVLTFGRSGDWTAANADPEVINLFSETTNSMQEFRNLLKAQLWSDLPGAAQTRVTGVFTTLGAPFDFGPNVRQWRIVRRLIGWLLQDDDGLGGGINF